MLYKVLYTHQKTKKQKTWQDGYLQMPSTGQKAVLLSEERIKLDNLYVGKGKLTVGASLESDRFLIEVDDEFIISDKVTEEDIIQKVQNRLPINMQSVTVRRQGLAAPNNQRKDFKPPYMQARKLQTFDLQDQNEFRSRIQSSSEDQVPPAHNSLLLGRYHQRNSGSIVKDENLDSSTHCYKPFNEACIGTESQRNVTLFCDPYMSREVDRQSPIGIDKPKLDGNHSKFLKVSNGANWCYEASNTSAINKDQIINVSDEEEKNSVMLKRSTDQILALFSKRPIDTFSEGRSTEVCYAELWNASRNDITFNKGPEHPIQKNNDAGKSSEGSPLLTSYSSRLNSTCNTFNQCVSSKKEPFMRGAVSSKMVTRPWVEFTNKEGYQISEETSITIEKGVRNFQDVATDSASPLSAVQNLNCDIQENEAKFYDGDKSIPQKFSEDLVATTILTDAPQGRNGLKRKMPNQFSLKAPFHPPKPISKSIKLAHTKHSNIDSTNAELLFPSLNDCVTKPLPTRMVTIPIEFRSIIEYKTIFKSALIEHLNILLFDLAKTYHTASKKVQINIASTTKSEAEEISLQGPCCSHGACRLQSVKKHGPTKGKLFYCCPQKGSDQCKFFMWVEDYQKKSCSNDNEKNMLGRITISDSTSANSFFNGQGVAFYFGCKFIRKEKNFYTNSAYGGKSRWSKSKFYMLDEEGICNKKSIFLTLPFKGSSSSYSKDDLWIVSKNLTFDSGCTFIAKSSFYGPNSSGDVEISPVSSYYPSKWESGETVHAILACNAGMEMCCIENLDKLNSINDMPILKHLIHRDPMLHRSQIALNDRFTCPFLISAEEDPLSTEDINDMIDKTAIRFCLNEDQALALRKITNMVINNTPNNEDDCHITLVHGVFGAGKSFLLAVVVLFLVEIFEKNMTKSRFVNWKILISSTTNVAVDRVLQGLLDLEFEDFVRVGSVKKIAKQVLPYSVHTSGTDNQELRELQSMLKSDLSAHERTLVKKSIEKHRLGLNRKKLREAPVVGVTCAASVFPCLDNLSFKVHLLDECSQMTEPLSMLPIARFKCEKLILVGDPKQLSPTIQGSESSNLNGLNKTLFDRLKQRGIEPVLLRTQYRCHPMISAIPNKLFYNGELRDGVLEDDRVSLQDWLNPVCFYNVSKGKEQCCADGSFYNLEEAEFVVFLINAMLLYGTDASHIGVITQYKSQVQKIMSLLLRQSALSTTQELKSIQISTVDAFQGAEKEIIILSCVRTDHVGFIDCERRTNVALTRAKRHLLIVGNLKMLVQNSLWSKIIECCSMNEEGITSVKTFRDKMEPIIAEKRILREQEQEDSAKGKRKKKIKKVSNSYDVNNQDSNHESI